MGLFAIFRKPSEESRDKPGERRFFECIDPRMAIVHEILREAIRIDPEIFDADESLFHKKGNEIREYVPDEREAGKTGKYPRGLFFRLYQPSARDGMTENGIHGTVLYLKDGTPGKATIDTWRDHAHFRIQAKLINGKMHVSYVDRNVMPDVKGKRIYDYRSAK